MKRIHISVGERWLADVDEFAEKNDIDRASAIRLLSMLGLTAFKNSERARVSRGTLVIDGK